MFVVFTGATNGGGDFGVKTPPTEFKKLISAYKSL